MPRGAVAAWRWKGGWGMSDGTEPGTELGKLLRSGRGRQSGAIPIWQSKLYQQRRVSAEASRIQGTGSRPLDDATLLREKRALADRLFDLCDRADQAVRRHGGDVEDQLERIAELSFIVSYWDSETAPEMGVWGPFVRLGESRDYLAAMVLACEVTKLAEGLDREPQKADEPEP